MTTPSSSTGASSQISFQYLPAKRNSGNAARWVGAQSFRSMKSRVRLNSVVKFGIGGLPGAAELMSPTLSKDVGRFNPPGWGICEMNRCRTGQ